MSSDISSDRTSATYSSVALRSSSRRLNSTLTDSRYAFIDELLRGKLSEPQSDSPAPTVKASANDTSGKNGKDSSQAEELASSTTEEPRDPAVAVLAAKYPLVINGQLAAPSNAAVSVKAKTSPPLVKTKEVAKQTTDTESLKPKEFTTSAVPTATPPVYSTPVVIKPTTPASGNTSPNVSEPKPASKASANTSQKPTASKPNTTPVNNQPATGLSGKSQPTDQNTNSQATKAPAPTTAPLVETQDAPNGEPLQNQPPATTKEHRTTDSKSDALRANKDAEIVRPATNRRAERLTELKKRRDPSNDDASQESDKQGANNPLPSAAAIVSANGIAIGGTSGLTSVSPKQADLSITSLVLASASTATTSDVLTATTSAQPLVTTETVSSAVSSAPAADAAITTSSSVATNSLETPPIQATGTWINGTNVSIATNVSDTTGTSSGTSLSPYQETKLVQRVLRGLEQLGEGGGQVRLRLHPPELGSLQLTVRIEGGQVNAQLDVETSAARDALLSNVHTLKERLADQGMKVDRFEVRIDPQASSNNANNSLYQQSNASGSGNQDRPTSRYAQQNNNRLSNSSDGSSTSKPRSGWTRNDGSLDLQV